MTHQTSFNDIILQRSSSLAEGSSLDSTFILQHRTGTIEQSSEEFHEMVSKDLCYTKRNLMQLLELFKIVFPFSMDNLTPSVQS